MKNPQTQKAFFFHKHFITSRNLFHNHSLYFSAITRLHPGASTLIVHTRWHKQDLIGRLTRKGKVGGIDWEEINLPAINDAGEALWPKRRPLAFLESQRVKVGPHDWASLYQGNPVAKGSKLFRDPHFYRELPPHTFRYSIGYDMAYTEQKRADHSSIVVMARDHLGDTYVLEVRRFQGEVDVFAEQMRGVCRKYPGVTPYGYIGGQEKAVVKMLNRHEGLDLRHDPASTDKFARAQDLSKGWNAGAIKVHMGAEWSVDFCGEFDDFTGVGGGVDDQVDAAAAAYDALQEPPPEYPEDDVDPYLDDEENDRW